MLVQICATSIRSLASKIVQISGKNIHLKFDNTKPMGPISRTADITHTKEVLGWQPQVSLDDGLLRTYEWIRTKLDTNPEI